MSALHQIKEAGFDVELVDDWIEISPADKLTQNQREFLKSHKAEIISELQTEKFNSANAEQIARAYCAAIGETDETIINDAINQCRHSAGALAYYAAQVDRSPAGSLHSVRAQAGGQGAGCGPGVCSAGAQGTGVCRWGSTEHRCSMYVGR